MDRLRVLSGHFASTSEVDGEPELPKLAVRNQGTSARLYRRPCPGGVGRQETKGFAGYEGFTEAQTMSAFPPATHDVFALDELLTEEEKEIKYRTRAFMVGGSLFNTNSSTSLGITFLLL